MSRAGAAAAALDTVESMARTLKGKARKETKQEERARLAANRAAHEQCQQIIPAALAVLVLVVLAFYLLLPPQAV